MKVLYLTEDYLYSKVHNNLLCSILEQDSNLQVYVISPVRGDNPHGLKDSFRHHERLVEITPKIDIPVWRFKWDFSAKITCKVRLIEKAVNIKDIDVVHAATLYTEGATAMELHKKYDIPYLASIRGADIMFYAHKMPHLWLKGIKVMKNAGALLSITPAIKEEMGHCLQHLMIRNRLQEADVVNNGIDCIWLENLSIEPRPIRKPARILYIGRFDSNKNVLRLIEAVKRIRVNNDVTLTLVGGKGEEHDTVLKQVTENSSYMEYLGPIYDKQELIQIVRHCDIFAMVSHSETFGLVYAECLTQGLPLLYTKGTGFDGIYPQGEIGYGVDSYSIESIVKGIQTIIKEYKRLRDNITRLDFTRYSWKGIAEKYIDYYYNLQNE